MANKQINKETLVSKDVFDNLIEGAKKSKAVVDMLELSLKAIKETSKTIKSQVSVTNPKDVKSVQELNQLTEKAAQLAKNKLQIDKEIQKEKLRAQGLNNQRNKALREEIALEGRQLGLEERLLKQNKALRLERAKLIETDKNYENELRRINGQLDKNNATLEATSDKMKKQRLGVGRYEQAIGKLRGGLTRLAGAFGLAFGAQAVVGFVKDLNRIAVESQGVTFAFERLGTEGADAFERVKKSTRGLLSNLEIKKSLVEFDNFNISLAESDTLFEFLSVRATQTGKSIDYLRDSLVEGLSKESKLRIDNLGISASELNAQLEITPNFVEAVAEIAKREIAEAGDILDSAASSSAKWSAELENTKETLATGLKPVLDKFLESGARGLRFFTDNLEAIGKAFKFLLITLVAYKTRLVAINVAQKLFITDSGKMSFNLKTLNKNLKDGAKESRGFGGALKSIGWAAIIALVFELGRAFIDAASGAKLFRDELEQFNKFEKGFLKDLDKKINGIKERLRTEKELIALKLEDKEITRAEAIERTAEATKKANAEFDLQIKYARDLKNTLLIGLKNLNAQEKAQGGLNIKQTAARKEQIRLIALQGAFIDTLKQEKFLLNDIGDSKTPDALDPDNVDKITKSYKDANEQLDLFNKRIEAQSEIDTESFTFTIEQYERQLDEAIKMASDNAEKTGNINLEKVNRILKDEEKLKRTKILNDYELALDNASNLEEVQLAQQRFRQRSIELDQEFADKKKAINTEVNDSQEKFADKQIEDAKRVKDAELKAAEETYQKLGEYIDLATDYFIKRADERIAKIQEETDAATKQADYFRELAANGNISAKESLAEQNRLIAESNAQKEEEEKRKQRILLVSSVLQAYNSNLEAGDKSGEAFTKALTSTTLLQGFISALPAFYDGTENTSIDGSGQNIDGKGGFHAVLHQNERVLTAKQNSKIGSYSNEEVANIMERHRLGSYMEGSQIAVGWDNHLLVEQMMKVESKLDEVTKAIENKPVPNIELGEITQSYMNINKRVETAKGSTTSRFKVK